MRAFIYSFRGKPWNEECQAAYNGFKKLGVECVLFSTNEELETHTQEDIVVAGILIMEHIFSQLKIKIGVYNYPKELEEYLHRKICTIKLSELQKVKLPVFIKPVEEKIAQGMIINSFDDLGEYNNLPPDTELLCSDVLQIISEWRAFIKYGKIIDIKHYSKDSNIKCDFDTIQKAVDLCHDMPASYSLDFCVTKDGKTCLVEMNDGFSIGCYGLDEEQYAMFLYARWAELAGVPDPFKQILPK